MNRLAVERKFFAEHPGAVFDEARHTLTVTRYAVEPYLEVVPELKALYPEHWAEVALDKEAIPLDPDYDAYAEAARAGILHLVTARVRGELVGYHLSFIRPHLHYKSSLTCFTDIFYLKPTHRKGMTGYRLLAFFRDSVKARGVQKIYMGTKLSLDIGPLLERLGFSPVERIYTQVFHAE